MLYFHVPCSIAAVNISWVINVQLTTLSGQGEGSEEILAELQSSLASILNSQCKCGVTVSHISEGEFSCRRGSDDSINYRARIKGTSSRSASDLVALIQSWVQGGQASVFVEGTEFYTDPSCNAALDNIRAEDCGPQPITPTLPPQPPTEPPSESDLKPPQQQTPFNQPPAGGAARSAQVGGIIIGGIVVGVLLSLMVAFIIMLKKNTRNT